MQSIQLSAVVSDAENGQRLDRALAALFPDYSRSRLKSWVLQGWVRVNDAVIEHPREKVLVGQNLYVQALAQDEVQACAQDLPLQIVYEDDDICIINKQAGLVVHPGAGVHDGTLLNALLHHAPMVSEVPRAGIIHRLDKDTTGLMVVAKTLQAQTRLVEMLQNREITREYEAIVFGAMTAGGRVDAPIGRHPRQRTQMAVTRPEQGKPAVTHYRVLEKFRAHTRLRLRLETGRTHQIRVHMAHLRHPIVGDPLYAGRPRLLSGASGPLQTCLTGFSRQALHAAMLQFKHPVSQELMQWYAPIPEDMQKLTHLLRADHQPGSGCV